MATGDDALTAGMDVLDPSTNLVKDGAEEINKTRDYIAQRTSAVQPVAKGGTGATTPAAARSNLGISADNIVRPGGDTIETTLLYIGANFATDAELAAAVAGKVSAGDSPTFGHIYTPAGRSTPVTTSYVAGYLNGDGRLGANPSAKKYKRAIKDFDGSALGLRPVTYVLKNDPNKTVRLGVVADEANEVEPMLVVHEDGKIESFKYELLAVALLKDVQRLAAEVAELKAAK